MSERVAIYNRCSTEEEAQVSALKVQVNESREIARSKGWDIVVQYVESQSGTTARRRSEYQRLLSEMEEDIFDIVMIKSIDRLTRSTKDWYIFLEKLTINKKRLYIYMDNKFYESQDSLLVGIKAILAEDFSRELSKKIKNAHKRRQERLEGYNITAQMFGWDRIKKDEYKINEEEAAFYRIAFEMALEGNGFYVIANRLYEQGARSRNGKKISPSQWRKMLYASRAHGEVVLHKKEYDFDTKTYREIPKSEWIHIKNAIPEIVEESYHKKVMEKMSQNAKRTDSINISTPKNRGKYSLSGKIVCECCKGMYYRKKSGKKIIWKCANAINYGKSVCSSRQLLEDEIYEILSGKYEISDDKIAKKINKVLEKCLKENDRKDEILNIQKRIEDISRKKDMLTAKLLEGVIGDEQFKRSYRILNDKEQIMNDKVSDIKRKYDVASKNVENSEYEKAVETIKEKELIKMAKREWMFEKVKIIYVKMTGELEIQTNDGETFR